MLYRHPSFSSDTILRAIEELTENNITYTSDFGKSYEFNKAEQLNTLLLDALLATGQLTKDGEYVFDFDHQFIETEKYDAKTTYKHFKGYGPGIAVINNMIVGIENRDGNANVRFHHRLVIQRQRRTDGELDLWEGEYTYRCILTNDFSSSVREIVEFYNQRGGKERIFDEMNNGFGWKHLPKSFMSQDAAFLLLTALIYNFYKYLISRISVKDFKLKPTSRIKTFVFKFISVAAKWIKAGRQNVLNVYTSNQAYANLDFG